MEKSTFLVYFFLKKSHFFRLSIKIDLFVVYNETTMKIKHLLKFRKKIIIWFAHENQAVGLKFNKKLNVLYPQAQTCSQMKAQLIFEIVRLWKDAKECMCVGMPSMYDFWIKIYMHLKLAYSNFSFLLYFPLFSLPTKSEIDIFWWTQVCRTSPTMTSHIWK